MKICVTGIAGFIGSHVADHLIALGHEVFGIDSLIGGEEENVPVGVADWGHLDCRELEPHHFADIDVVVHCAALAHEGLSVFSPKIITDNVMGSSVAVFSAAIAGGVKRIVNFSSMSRYGKGVPPFRETDRCRPVDPYGIAKVAAENTLRCLCEAHGIEHVTIVPHSVYGERQAIDPFRNVATIFVNRMLQGKPPIVYGDGRQVRCFSYVADVVPTVSRLTLEPQWNGHVFNVGPDEESITINGLLDILKPLCGFDGDTVYLPPRPLEVKNATCSSEKARKLLGYRTHTSLKEGLSKLVSDVKMRGPRPFRYHLPIEINSESVPSSWKNKLL